ncbi:CBS domain-containing protein [uncultured Ilyobacter sp.]|uniref:CBS domain-containing protein n=1 Tax=uncultured Ilyobacter sp. TaxID=544433 RepID=UPI0029F53C5D|nr:CBS domain-containing protein [uncultured Ilyobacter sp.]
MPSVKDILTKKGHDVVSVDWDTNVAEAARLMNDRHIGAVVVTRDATVVGIFTERDVLCRIVAATRDPEKTLVREVMTSPVACCDLDTNRDECRAVMRNRRIRHLPVVDADERLAGIISIGDIVADEGEEKQETIHYLYEMMSVNWKAEK